MSRRGVIIACALGASLRADTFSTQVYPVFQAANCRVCHTEGGLAASTRLRFPPENAAPAQIDAFGKRLSALLDRNAPERSLLIRKPTNREKHTGGQLIQPGGKEEAALLRWIRELPAAPAEAGAEPDLSEPWTRFALRRLTHSQYNNTVRDLLGDETRPADRLPPEDFVDGFKNQIAAQDISPVLAEAYNSAAERLAKAAFRGGTDDQGLIPCKPRSARDAQCRAQFVRSFGLRAFRRPLTDSEQRRYEQAFEKAASGGTFFDGAQLVVEAMLQSPKFLFHSGVGGRAYRAASSLSYFLWDTMPDAELLESAASGELLTPAGLDAAIARMLRDPKARQGVDEFVSQWLRFDLALGAVKDRALYPQFNPELAAAMSEESRRLIADIVWNGRSFMEVFTAGYAFVNSDLASLYGLKAPQAEFARIAFPPDSDRAGVIGQALFLAMTSKPGETSPTVRGYFVRDRFLCQQVPDPPPGINSSLPPLSEDKPQTNRQRLHEHTINAACRGCHNLMDPIGFGLERYDAIGRRREKQTIRFEPNRLERGKKTVTVELPLDASGVVEGIADSAFSSAKELGEVLARSAECQECIVKQLFRYAFGRRETPADRALLDSATAVFRKSGFRLTALMAYLGNALTSPEGGT
jgi:hypothetical protein